MGLPGGCGKGKSQEEARKTKWGGVGTDGGQSEVLVVGTRVAEVKRGEEGKYGYTEGKGFFLL